MAISRWRHMWIRILLLTTLAWSAVGAAFLENADRWLSYDWGKLLIKPQLGLSTKFTDNVFYGNDSVVTSIFANQVAPQTVVIPGVLTNTISGGIVIDGSPNPVTVGVGYITNAANLLIPVFTNRYPAHVKLVNGIPVSVPEQTAVRPYPGATTIGTNNVPTRPVESEFFFIASPGIRLQFGNTGLNTLTFEYNYDRIFYFNNPEFDTAQHRTEFGANLKLGRFTITGTDSIHLLSSFLHGNNANVSNQVDRLVWNDNYRVTYDATAKTDVYVKAIHSLLDYDEGVSIYDSETIKGGLGASYIWTEKLRIFVEGEYGQSYVGRNLATQSEAPSSTVFGGFVGVRGTFTPRIEGNLRIGYESRIFPGTFAPGDEPASVGSPAVTADLNYAVSAKTFLKLAYTRTTDVSPQFAKQSYIFDRVQLTANQFIGHSGKWLATANVGFTAGDYSETPGINLARSDRVLEGGLRLTYQPRAWLAAILAYEYENYSSDFKDPTVATRSSLVDYQANSLTLSLKIGY